MPDDQIYYSVDAQAQNVQSDKLIPGHVLKADRLAITADRRDGLKIAGRATVSGIPVEGSWIMPLDESSDGSSRLTGAVNVSQETSDVFALGLPDRTISGTGLGRVEIDFPNKATPKLRFFTDLNRIRLSLPPIGWSKSAQRTGEFEILVDLADPPHVTALTLDAPGLKASGSVTLDSEGALELAAFKELRIGRWFNGNIELIGRGANVPFDIAVKGGRMDLRSSEFGTSSGNGAGALGVILDRLDVSENISLTNLRGDFDPSRGLQGRFFARINGKTEVTGSLVPSRHGTALTLNSANGGGVLRDAGLLDNGVGGLMKMTLVPRAREGFYDGTLEISDIRVKDAPALAELFSAISVIGLLEQLDGGGLPFNLVSATLCLLRNGLSFKAHAQLVLHLGSRWTVNTIFRRD